MYISIGSVCGVCLCGCMCIVGYLVVMWLYVVICGCVWLVVMSVRVNCSGVWCMCAVWWGMGCGEGERGGSEGCST